jgi:hypothetical protein
MLYIGLRHPAALGTPMRRLLFPTALAILAASAHAQTFVPRYGPGIYYSGVSADSSLVQLSDQTGHSALYTGSGAWVHANAGFSGAAGVSNTGRETLAVDDPSFPLPFPLLFVRQGNDVYPPALPAGGTALFSPLSERMDPVSGRLGFTSYDPDSGQIRYGIDTGTGAATEFSSDGTVGTHLISFQSVSKDLVAGIGVDEGGNRQAWWYDTAFHLLPLAPGQQADQLRLSVLPTGAQYVTGIIHEGPSSTFGTAWLLSAGGTASNTGLHIDGAIGSSGDFGGLSAFWGPYHAYQADLSTGATSEIRTSTGDILQGVTDAFARQGTFYVSSSFGAGTVQAVPEPASLAALGVGLLALRRRGRSS